MALLDPPEEGSSMRLSADSNDGKESEMASVPVSLDGNVSADKCYPSPATTEVSSAELCAERSLPDGPSQSEAEESLEYPPGCSCPPGRGAAAYTAEMPPFSPLEVPAYGGIGHIPLSWTLPRAVVAHGLQSLGLWDTLAIFSPRAAEGSATPANPYSRPQKATLTQTASARTGTKPDAIPASIVGRHRPHIEHTRHDGATTTASLAGLRVHRPASETRYILHPSTNERPPSAQMDMAILEEWRDDIAVEPLFVIPSSCFSMVLEQEPASARSAEILEDNRAKNILRGYFPGLSGNAGQTQAPASRRFLRRQTSSKRFSCSLGECAFEGVEAKVLGEITYTRASPASWLRHETYSTALARGIRSTNPTWFSLKSVGFAIEASI